jgi:hypothetical protein
MLSHPANLQVASCTCFKRCFSTTALSIRMLSSSHFASWSCVVLLCALFVSASIVDVRYGDNDGECFIIHSDGSGVWAPCPPDNNQRNLDPASRLTQKLTQASAKHLPRLRNLMDQPSTPAVSSARKLFARGLNPAPVDTDAIKTPLLASHVEFITADQLLTYTLSSHKPLLLLPWYSSCALCNATASIVEHANKLLGDHALNVRAVRWEDDALWGSWLGNQSLLFMLNSSFHLPEPPISFVMNGITWYSRGEGTTPFTEAPAAVEYPQLLNISLPASCSLDVAVEGEASDATALHDRRCIFDTAAFLSRAVRLRMPVLCQTISCALLQRCNVRPAADAVVSECNPDDALALGSKERLQYKLSLDGSYAFAQDDFLGGNYERAKILFDDGGSSAASDLFRLFALLLQDEASPLDFALMGDPQLVGRFNAPPSSLIVTSFPYMDVPRVISSSAWTLQQLYRMFE